MIDSSKSHSGKIMIITTAKNMNDERQWIDNCLVTHKKGYKN